MANPEIVELARRAISGDKDAFEELCMRKSKDLIFNAMGILGDYHEAEDAAQETIISMYTNIGKLRDPETVEVWMLRIVKNRCYRILEKGKNRRTYSDVDDEAIEIADDDREFLPEEYAEDAELGEQLYEIILGLPQKKREAILMFYYDDMSYKEIAEIQGTSIKTVSTNISRARIMIQEKLNEQSDISSLMLGAGTGTPVLSRVLKQQVDIKVPDKTVAAFQHSWKEAIAPMKYTAGTAKFFPGTAMSVKTVVTGIIATVIVITGVVAGAFFLGYEVPKSIPDVKGEIVFVSEGSAFSQLNPDSATLTGVDLAGAMTPDWRITDKATGAVLAEGRGQTVSAGLKQMKETAPAGNYQLIYSVTDQDGYIIEVERGFLISPQ
jgi:RNA polymerase sigma-70 factor (ECF subfamily)